MCSSYRNACDLGQPRADDSEEELRLRQGSVAKLKARLWVKVHEDLRG